MKVVLVAVAICSLCAWFAFAEFPAAQVKIMPGSVVRGEALLEDKACLSCHAVNGRGGSRAMDFAVVSGRNKTPSALASTMWNHSPSMWAEYRKQNREVPALTSFEAADLFTYFYSILYFAPQGDRDRGKAVFEQKNCLSCHAWILDRALMRRGSWLESRDPAVWAEQMWNHASEMDTAVINRGLAWPSLSEQEMVDLLTFVSGQTLSSIRVGEPEPGRAVFERSCESCHSLGVADRSKVNLLRTPKPSSVASYIAAMWNHAPIMRRRGGSTAKLDPGEMQDVIAFLFSQRYFFEPGDPVRGRAAFEEKGCASCHGRPVAKGAPDLFQAAEVYSPVTLTAAAWRHGAGMLATMEQQGIAWPEFRESEMTDLIAYLNSRWVVRVADQPADERR
jgi:mono/diheme cytochrome c family protein